MTMKLVLLKQPKILSKVIPRFESKLGAGRLYCAGPLEGVKSSKLKSRPSWYRGEICKQSTVSRRGCSYRYAFALLRAAR